MVLSEPIATGPFVRRRIEVALLADALDVAASGTGSAVLLAGSGGMGKTRLAQELVLRAEQVNSTVPSWRCCSLIS